MSDNTPLFERVTIIGLGLIGSSVAHALRRSGAAGKVVGADISPDVCERAHDLGFADVIIKDLAASVKGSDVVVLAVPVGAFDALGQVVGPALKPGAVVMDTGSVKGRVIETFMPHVPEGVHFIPAHPISGTEFSGPESGFASLFDDRWCVLTPTSDADLGAIEKATQFWEACGARIEIMDAEHHDLVLGITSHLPHLIAYTIVGTASDLEGDTKSEVIKFSASGFRDFTRIAASDPVMWRDVFLNNRAAVLEILQRFNEDLTALQKAIRRGDGEFLHDAFERTRDIRKAIIELGQADYRSAAGQDLEGTPAVVMPTAGGRQKSGSHGA